MKQINAPFTHDQLVQIEWQLSRAILTIGKYADEATMAQLKAAGYIFAEVRNAGLYLSDPKVNEDTRAAVCRRLLELFATDKE